MFLANKLGVRNIIFYAILGIGGVWTAFLLSGVHATIAAVLAAFMIPADVVLEEDSYISKIQRKLKHFKELDSYNIPTLTDEQLDTLQQIKENTNAAIPPLQRLEYRMHPFVTFVVIPLFALANAGVSLVNIEIESLFSTNIAIGVALGLLLGKVAGVVGFTSLMVKLKVAPLPDGMNFRNLLGIGLLASIGFTMSLFITSLAFNDETHLVQAKIGIFVASIIGGIIGYIILNKK